MSVTTSETPAPPLAARHTPLSIAGMLLLAVLWGLSIPIVAQRPGKKVAMITLADLAASEVAAFLSHTEHDRGGTIGTRICRLAAIRSFFHFVATRDPGSIVQCVKS